MAAVPQSPPPGSAPADVDGSTAMLELKVTKLKRALATCIERQNQLQEENAKLRKMLDTSGITTDSNRALLNMYEAKVSVFLSFLREENEELWFVADQTLNKQLTNNDTFNSKASINAELTLRQEKLAVERAREEEERDKRVAAAAQKASKGGAAGSAAKLTAAKAAEGAEEGEDGADGKATDRIANRRYAVKPPRRKSTMTRSLRRTSSGVDDPASAGPTGAAFEAVEREAAALRLQLSEQSNEMAKLRSTTSQVEKESAELRKNLSMVVLFQLRKSATASRAQSKNKMTWGDAPNNASPGPSILREAVTLRQDQLGIGRALPEGNVALPSMPQQQGRLQMRSRYGYFDQSAGLPSPTKPKKPRANARGARAGELARNPDAELLASAMHNMGQESTTRGMAFRIAMSAHIDDMAKLMQRADPVLRRFEEIYDKLHSARLENAVSLCKATATQRSTASALPSASELAATSPPAASVSEPGAVLETDEIAGMADLIATDFESDVPDSLTTDPVVRTVLAQDAGWSEEVALMSLQRRTLAHFLQRRAEHAQARIGALLDVKYDPRRLREAFEASRAEAERAGQLLSLAPPGQQLTAPRAATTSRAGPRAATKTSPNAASSLSPPSAPQTSRV